MNVWKTYSSRPALIAISVLVVGLFSLRIAHSLITNVTTTVTTTPAVVVLTQSDYRWYENANAVTPTTALAAENTAYTTPETGTILRLRMNLLDANVTLSAGATFKLQFSTATSSGFADVGTSTGAWVFGDNAGVVDGLTLPSTLISNSDVAESYNESNPSATSPSDVNDGQRGEWDWVVKNNSAATSTQWYFRMIYASSTVLDSYTRYPTLSATTPSGGGGPGGGTSGGGSVNVPGNYPVITATSVRPLKPSLEPLVPPSPCDEPATQRIDLNYDCAVNIIDLSILLYYYGQSGPDIDRYDFNNNSTVDFPDVSVMMFYWTA